MNTLYAMREVQPDTYEVTSFEEFRTEPVSHYRVGRGTRKFCTCPGFGRSAKLCRHQQMVEDVIAADLDFRGLFWEKETDQLYRPIPGGPDYPCDVFSED